MLTRTFLFRKTKICSLISRSIWTAKNYCSCSISRDTGDIEKYFWRKNAIIFQLLYCRDHVPQAVPPWWPAAWAATEIPLTLPPLLYPPPTKPNQTKPTYYSPFYQLTQPLQQIREEEEHVADFEFAVTF